MNLSNLSQIRHNGKNIALAKLNGDIVYRALDPGELRLIMTYTIADTSNKHTFNEGFVYTMERTINEDNTYTVNLYSDSDFTSFRCNTNTLTIDYLRLTGNVTSMERMFSDCTLLTSLDLTNCNSSNVTDMSLMFYNCTSLTSIKGISNINTSKVIEMQSMFQSCAVTSLDLSKWDTSNVTYISQIFYECPSLTTLNITGWNISNVNYCNYLCLGCTNLKTVEAEGLDFSNTYMSVMFLGCSSLTSINVKNWKCGYSLIGFITRAPLLESIDLSGWDSSRVTNMNQMFSYCTNLKEIKNISDLNTSNVTDMSMIFTDCSSLTSLDLSKWNTSNVTDMRGMFCNCSSLTSLNLSTWDTNNVTGSSEMFTNVPTYIDWNYNGYNYYNFTLRARECDFAGGTFPWEKAETYFIDFESMSPSFPDWFYEYNCDYEYSFSLDYLGIYDPYTSGTMCGLVAENKGIDDTTSWICYKITPPSDYTMYVNFLNYGESNFDYLTIHVSQNDYQPDAENEYDSDIVFHGKSYCSSDRQQVSVSLDKSTEYYLHLQYKKDSSVVGNYDVGIIYNIELS